ncbi:hypothetical protein C1H46_004302 [Malus baccata]|uniref:Uncharacterized protein n=1 Tax=Malus baccata TaxID=106549 RepID=A0A540NGH1_MALBA|nr:hypothetical protein C1H46_004302 [Malus baccata]
MSRKGYAPLEDELIKCDRRSAREADDASRQASKASSQKSSPNIQRDNIKGKEGSKATSQ